LIRSSLRGPSDWSVGERELFAAATSQANACSFCADIHSCTATLTLGEEITPELLEKPAAGVFRH
jgi:AhpD family alkylhydroperoxidase